MIQACQSTRITVGSRRESGVALFISLVLLLVLTIIGVSAVQSTSLEVRMARNDHDSMLAFQAAESALRDAEDRIELVGSIAEFTDGGANGLWTVADLGDPARWENAAIWASPQTVVAPSAIAGVDQQPRYMIEHVASVVREENAHQQGDPYNSGSGSADAIEMFRVTALGFGGTANARTMLQATYGRIID